MSCSKNIHAQLIIALAILFLAGCGQPLLKEVRHCPGVETSAQSFALLSEHTENKQPIKANGRCVIEYYDDDHKKHRDGFAIKLWANPPGEIYMQGDVAFDGRAIVLGTNKEEFWLAIKPELSSYWWGRWSRQSRDEQMIINPKMVLEALGIAGHGEGQGWSLSNDGNYDILTKQIGPAMYKKIHIRTCDYLAGKIEYLDDNSGTVVTVELDKYKQVAENLWVPKFVKIIHTGEQTDGPLIATIRLNSIKQTQLTEKQRRRLFIRPEPIGFKHIYQIDQQ